MAEGVGLSIIIPMYNVGDYLDKCIASLLRTDGIGNAQIILVDDGSTDSTAKIADDYTREYSNISVIHKQNEGPSEARNTGIRASEGKYLFFCDADDEVNPDELSKVISGLDTVNADILLWDAELFNDTGDPIPDKRKDYFIHRGLNENDGVITGEQTLEKQLDACMNYPATVWLGIHSKEFLLNNGLYFEKGLLHEDELWATLALLYAKRVMYIQRKVYRYRIHTGSITNPVTDDRTQHIESLLVLYPRLYSFCEESVGSVTLKRKLEATLTRRYLHMIFEYDFCKRGYADRLDIGLLWRTSVRLIDKCRVIVLAVEVTVRRLFGGR